MRRVTISCLTALVWLALACTSEAQAPMAVVDVQKVINQSISGRAARNNVESEVKKSEARLGQLKSQLDKLRADIEKQSSVLSAEALEEKRKAVVRRERELNDEAAAQREELSRKHSGEIEKVLQEVKKVAADIASQRNLGLIVERDPRLVLYASERVDISDDVIKELDRRKTQL